MPRCECGLTYVSGIDEDEKQHEIWHDEYLHGAILPDMHALSVISSVAVYPLVVVDAAIPREARFRLSKAAYVAQRATPDYPAGYDGTISEADERLFLARDGDRAIGVVLTALDEYYWSLTWTHEGTVQLLDRTPHRGPLQKIGRVWVAKAYRRRDIASLMVKAVVEILGYEVSDIGWELPLTEDGAALLQKLVPSKWWGRGDTFALRDTLDAPRRTSL